MRHEIYLGGLRGREETDPAILEKLWMVNVLFLNEHSYLELVHQSSSELIFQL